MYARFTDDAKKVMFFANEEARRLFHEYIGTEHLLLGLLREGSGIPPDLLKRLKVDASAIHEEIDKLVKIGSEKLITGKLPQTPASRKAVEYAIDEARHCNDTYVRTGHLFLGVLREEESFANEILTRLGFNLTGAREAVLERLEQEARKREPPPSEIPAVITSQVQAEQIGKRTFCVAFPGDPDAISQMMQRFLRMWMPLPAGQTIDTIIVVMGDKKEEGKAS